MTLLRQCGTESIPSRCSSPVPPPGRLPTLAQDFAERPCSSGLRPAVHVGRLSRGLRRKESARWDHFWRSPLYQIRETRPGGSAFRVSRRVHLSHRAGDPFCVPGGDHVPTGKSLAGAPVFAASPSLDPGRATRLSRTGRTNPLAPKAAFSIQPQKFESAKISFRIPVARGPKPPVWLESPRQSVDTTR